jgi:serine/threonine-protein kinase
MAQPTDETSLAETGVRSGAAAPGSGSAGSGSSRPGWLSSSAQSSGDPSLAPGALLAERYRILGLAGRGGMGEVYRADDLRLGQQVALKFLPPAVAGDPLRLAQFHHEVRIARQVSHRNVCRVYDIGEDHGRVFLTMELVDGEDLAALLKRVGRFPEERATEIARQLCAGLAAAHDCGVLHRDLKPANVMLDGEGRVRITDFGLAGVAGTFEDIRSGTPGYMAPEQLAGREVTKRSDVFALGLVLFEIYTGKRAFAATTIAELLQQHDEGVHVSQSAGRELDPSVERVIQRCLSREPGQRPASAIAVSAALPGGDPLAAALAAGETPSPAMVAAAGRIEPVPLTIGLSLVASAIIALALLIGLRGESAVDRFVPMDLSGPVLEDRARQAIQKLGYREPPVDSVGMFYRYGAYFEWARRRGGERAWSELASGRTPAVGYWYRTSPEALRPLSEQYRPQTDDPPLRIAGMTQARVDVRGYLLEFHGVPPQYNGPPNVGGGVATPPVVDWQLAFDVVGWPRDRFSPAAPEWTGLAPTDTRAAWTGTIPELGSIPLRLEAGAFAGRITFIQTVGPWSKPTRVAAPVPTFTQRMLGLVQPLLIASLIIGSALLARRNLRAGRGDRAGAWRVALCVGVLFVLRWLVVAHHAGTYATFQGALLDAAETALMNAAILWLAYLGIEPWLRRHWPGSLLSWSRLLGGSVRDPLVGRDVLVGVVFGVLAGLYLVATGYVIHQATGTPLGPTLNGVTELTTPRFVVALMIGGVTNALMNGVLLALLYVMLRRLLRRPLPAAAGVVLIFATLIGAGERFTESWWLNPLLIGAFALILMLPLVRFGLLPFMVAFFIHQLLASTALTTNLGAWYAPPTWVVCGLIVALAVTAFVQSRAGAPLFGRLLEES